VLEAIYIKRLLIVLAGNCVRSDLYKAFTHYKSRRVIVLEAIYIRRLLIYILTFSSTDIFFLISLYSSDSLL